MIFLWEDKYQICIDFYCCDSRTIIYSYTKGVGITHYKQLKCSLGCLSLCNYWLSVINTIADEHKLMLPSCSTSVFRL